ILADDPQEDGIEGQRNQHQERKRRETGWPRLFVKQPQRGIEYNRQSSKRGQQDTHHARKPQRQSRMADYAVQSEIEQGCQSERSLGALAFFAIIGNADLLITKRTDVTAQIWILVAIQMEEIEHTAVDQPKVTGIEREIVVAHPGDDPIKHTSRG